MSRADARRRTREAQRAEMADPEDVEGIEEAQSVTAAPQERKPLFKMPNFREDIRILPSIFREKRIVYLPLLMLLVGLPLWVLFARNQLAPEVAQIAYYYIQFFYIPPALFTFFLAGFWVPRAAYLVGFVYGIIAAIIWSTGFILVGAEVAADGSTGTAPADIPTVIASTFLYGIVYGTIAAALASWYRGFLTQMQERGKQRRAEREVDERAKRAAQRQEARKLAKQRPT
jgi:signal transduction histidine kinase